jgi:O-antigen/teichoic acid export membrane protein
VGYYATAIKICKIPLAFMTALSMALIPRISASFASGNHEYVKSLVQKSFAYIILLAVPIGVGLWLLGPELIQLLANQNFSPAIAVIRVLAPLTLLIGLSNLFAMQILTSMGKERLTLYAVTMGMVLSVVCNLLLIPRFSYMGTAYTTLLTEGFVTILTGWHALRFFHVQLPYRLIWQSLLGCILFYPAALLVEKHIINPFARIAGIVAFASCLYFITQYFVFKNTYIKETVRELLSKIRYGKV